jgi:hypothetical protein
MLMSRNAALCLEESVQHSRYELSEQAVGLAQFTGSQRKHEATKPLSSWVMHVADWYAGYLTALCINCRRRFSFRWDDDRPVGLLLWRRWEGKGHYPLQGSGIRHQEMLATAGVGTRTGFSRIQSRSQHLVGEFGAEEWLNYVEQNPWEANVA